MQFLEHHPHIAKSIRQTKKPRDAWAAAARYKAQVRSDWPNMDTVLWQELTQFAQLKQEPLATGDAQLVEVFSDLFGYSLLTGS
ncbi:hypothetical protein B0H17DRAFT_1211069 [Mycena rosella]|uniref:Uncharacterized protein n=1 Tax=Mycena rosella TaxID=1033263 RepID=A0AAD7CW46_MYCRO|nr:hypothetical protein B0H17DRAFT_1211069 [Mycena rosella]